MNEGLVDKQTLLADCDFKPQTKIESHLIEEMADVIWRKGRLKKAEQATYVEQSAEKYSHHDVKKKLAKEHGLMPLMRYEIHLDRKFERLLSVYFKLKELGERFAVGGEG